LGILLKLIDKIQVWLKILFAGILLKLIDKIQVWFKKILNFIKINRQNSSLVIFFLILLKLIDKIQVWLKSESIRQFTLRP
jgi:hypothetical protein